MTRQSRTLLHSIALALAMLVGEPLLFAQRRQSPTGFVEVRSMRGSLAGATTRIRFPVETANIHQRSNLMPCDVLVETTRSNPPRWSLQLLIPDVFTARRFPVIHGGFGRDLVALRFPDDVAESVALDGFVEIGVPAPLVYPDHTLGTEVTGRFEVTIVHDGDRISVHGEFRVPTNGCLYDAI